MCKGVEDLRVAYNHLRRIILYSFLLQRSHIYLCFESFRRDIASFLTTIFMYTLHTLIIFYTEILQGVMCIMIAYVPQLEAHLHPRTGDCPLAVVPCPYKPYGCTFVVSFYMEYAFCISVLQQSQNIICNVVTIPYQHIGYLISIPA